MYYVMFSSNRSGVSERAYFVFSSLAPHAIPALIDNAISIITPVIRGVTRPIDTFSMTDRHKVVEEMFKLPPVSLLREHHMDDIDHSEILSMMSYDDDVMMM